MAQEPLAFRMAPRTLAEYVGQRHLLAPGKLLRRQIDADRLQSMILFGPPGTGKTSLAKIIARQTAAAFRRLNAVTAGVKDIKAVIDDAENPLITPEGKTILFIDEIHRFNKAQQDALLPKVEDGTLILIGATTENPYFEVNKALLSRCSIFQLHELSEAELQELILAALHDPERGYGHLAIELEAEALAFMARYANGDARRALNALELAVLTEPAAADGSIHLNLETVADCMQTRRLRFDKDGEEHYNTISAFIKSMRGSDPDATLHYLARLLESGESIEFIARRIIICSAEDVGMANPQALAIATSALHAIQAIGMPEARIILAEAALVVATSPKSNAGYRGIDSALADFRSKNCGEVPLHLRNAPVKGMAEEFGYGINYKYAHDYPGNIVAQQYLPDPLVGTRYYQPTANGYEKKIRDWLDALHPEEGHERAKG